jgi:hypothetical protein
VDTSFTNDGQRESAWFIERLRLFFTATPRHYDVRKKNKEGENTLVYSMDKPEIYGPVVHTLSFAEAARRGIICDYKVVISVVTSDMVDDHLLRHGEVLVGGDPIKARQVALQISLQKAVEKYGVSRIFTFHGSVKAARSFTSEDSEGICQHLPDFITLHVSGEMPTARREEQMKAFRQADKAVISNARCLTEGVDVPAVDMVAFISPRKSKVDIVQATGRAMRRSAGKEFGYVMVPLFVEQAANETIEEALKRTGFDDVWDLLGAMREQDDVLVDIIRSMQEDKGRTGGYNDSRFCERVEVLGPSISLDTIRESITAECLESLGVSWDEWFGQLQCYKKTNGHTNVELRDPSGLGVWVRHQREQSKNNQILAQRRSRLDEIGFEWNSLESRWEKMFDELCRYQAKFGTTNVSINWPTYLGTWVSLQRKAKKGLGRGKLSIEREEKLNSINFVWDSLDFGWNEKYEELLEYKSNFGTSDVPTDWPTGLGNWVSQQRASLTNGSLSVRREDLLNKLGFVWNSFDKKWNDKFNELINYKIELGDTDVPREWPNKLGVWVGVQRRLRSDGELSLFRIERLDGIDFIWDAFDYKWRKLYQELLEYKAKYGSTSVPISWPTKLGVWVRTQRKAKKNGEIDRSREQLLDEAGFLWSSRKDDV